MTARAEAFQPGHLTWRALVSRRHWESVKEIQKFCQRLDFIHVADKCNKNFFNKLSFNCDNCVLAECLRVFSLYSRLLAPGG